MTLPELDEQLRDDYSSLLVVVDLANIRPRGGEHLRRFLGKFSKSWKFRSVDGPTSFEFIDQCLFDLERMAPGAVIVQFADFALRDRLSRADQKEFIRRQALNDFDRNKIFVVGTAKADEPVLNANFHVGGVIVSGDGFNDEDYQQWKTERTEHFKQEYSLSANSFSFLRRDDSRGQGNSNLNIWWSQVNGFVTGDWLASDDYLDVEFALRNRVREISWPWIAIPLTHKPEIPENIYELLKPQPKKKRRIGLSKRSARISQESEETLSKDPSAAEFSDVESCGSAVGVSSNSAAKKRPNQYLLADNFAGMRKFDGQYVTVVGHLVGEEMTKLQWLPGTEAIELEGLSITSFDAGNAFVECSGTLVIRGDSFSLMVADKNAVALTSYASIRNHLKDQSRSVRTSSPDAQPWKVLNLAESVLALLHLRRQVVGESEAVHKLNDGDVHQTLATDGSSLQIRNEVASDTSSDNQTSPVDNSAPADFGMRGEVHIGTHAESDVESVNQVSPLPHTEFFPAEVERDTRTAQENIGPHTRDSKLEPPENQRGHANRESFEKRRLVSRWLFWSTTALLAAVAAAAIYFL